MEEAQNNLKSTLQDSILAPMNDPICAYKTTDSIEAELVKGYLEELDIPCYLKSDNGGGTLPHLTALIGIQVMVRQEDLEQAKLAIDKRE